MQKNNAVTETAVEVTIQVPQTGFSESLPTNIGLIRQRYPEKSLVIESKNIGSISKTTVNILYDSKKVNENVLKEVKEFHAVLKKNQEGNVDPIGFGLHYRGRHIESDDWKTWQSLYRTIKFKINADINISDTGLVE